METITDNLQGDDLDYVEGIIEDLYIDEHAHAKRFNRGMDYNAIRARAVRILNNGGPVAWASIWDLAPAVTQVMRGMYIPIDEGYATPIHIPFTDYDEEAA